MTHKNVKKITLWGVLSWIFGWTFGIVGSLLGMMASLVFDIPTGATIVVTFAALLSIVALIRQVFHR